MNREEMKVQYIDHMGDDKAVVNAARVSFDQDEIDDSVLSGRDEGLIRYLAEHNHWTPFAQVVVKLRCTAPIFLVRQLYKHKVGGTENEVSRRYVDAEPDFWFPEVFRARAQNLKQGSSKFAVTEHERAHQIAHRSTMQCLQSYEELLALNVAPELARIVLPLNMNTSWYWQGSLSFWARVCHQRLEEHAQKEAQDFAKLVSEIVEPLFPVSWKALVKNN